LVCTYSAQPFDHRHYRAFVRNGLHRIFCDSITEEIAMGAMLTSLRNTAAAGLVLAILLAVLIPLVPGEGGGLASAWWTLCFRWLHVMSGTMWIGLLWYFNFVQLPNMDKIPDHQRPAIGKVIAPAALWWYRWSAMATMATGLLLAWTHGYLWDALAMGLTDDGRSMPIGIGMWLGIIMWINVWFGVWPNQERALGIVDATPEESSASARAAMLFLRANALISIPMLFCMVGMSHGRFG
jgi:uncharacterized membrane protein